MNAAQFLFLPEERLRELDCRNRTLNEIEELAEQWRYEVWGMKNTALVLYKENSALYL